MWQNFTLNICWLQVHIHFLFYFEYLLITSSFFSNFTSNMCLLQLHFCNITYLLTHLHFSKFYLEYLVIFYFEYLLITLRTVWYRFLEGIATFSEMKIKNHVREFYLEYMLIRITCTFFYEIQTRHFCKFYLEYLLITFWFL